MFPWSNNPIPRDDIEVFVRIWKSTMAAGFGEPYARALYFLTRSTLTSPVEIDWTRHQADYQHGRNSAHGNDA